MLRHALRADLPAIADTWVDAFAQDPYLRWIAPGDDDWRRFGPAWMEFIASRCFARGHTFLDDGVAVAWIPPDLSLVGPGDLERARQIIVDHAGEPRADEAVSTIMAARAHEMEEPHWILQYVGVGSAAQGAGRGLSAVRPTMDVIDREGLPCALTSTNPRNLPFYERLGFVVVAEESTPGGEVTLRPMERR